MRIKLNLVCDLEIEQRYRKIVFPIEETNNNLNFDDLKVKIKLFLRKVLNRDVDINELYLGDYLLFDCLEVNKSLCHDDEIKYGFI